MVAVVVPAAGEVTASVGNRNVFSDLADANAIDSALARIDHFRADEILVVESVSDWDLCESLNKFADDNRLCELLFLVAQRYVAPLKRGDVELWGLFLNAWNGVVHPVSGAIAGLLKSVHREIASARTGTICTKGLSLNDTL